MTSAPGVTRKLRLGIDARDLLVSPRTGVEVVAAQFIEHVGAVVGLEVVLFTDRPLGDRAPVSHRCEQVVLPPRYPRGQRVFDCWMVLQLGPALPLHRIDAFYSINTKFPLGDVPA